MATSPALGAPAPVLAVVDGIPTTTSTDVARHFGKRHDDVLKAVRNLIGQLDGEHLRNFAEASVEVVQPNGGKATYPAYRITRDGFTLLAMGFTGKKALTFKLAYIDAFNKMEAKLQQRPLELTLSPQDMRDAVALASGVGMGVQMRVLDALLKGHSQEQVHDSLRTQRWMLFFDRNNQAKVKPIAADARLLSPTQLSKLMADTAATAWERLTS